MEPTSARFESMGLSPGGAAFEPTLQGLLAHAGWARRLAVELVGDTAQAEDVVQEAFLAVLRRPPGPLRSPRAWLARAVTNTARQLARSERRRARREEASARSEELPSAADLAEALECQRRLADGVLALEEPYRRTLFLRFFHELEPTAIARAEGVPAGTVRSRLKRGLEALRESLDREHGADRGAWGVALARGLAKPLRPATRASGFGGSAVAIGAGLACLGTLVAAILWLRGETRSAPTSQPAILAESEAQEGGASAGPLWVQESTPRAEETASQASSRTSVSTLPPVPPPKVYVGRVSAPDGAPIAGATLRIYPNKSWPRPAPIGVGTSEADGAFRIVAEPTDSTYIIIGAEAEDFWGLTMDPVVPEHEIAITLAWTAEVFGVVRDAATGVPLEGVLVRGELEPVRTDREGRYRLPGVRTAFDVRLEARDPRFVKQDQVVYLRTNEPCEIDWLLERGVPMAIAVVDRETGEPKAGVEVRESQWHEPFTTTDAEGRFGLRVATALEVGIHLAPEGYCPTDWSWTVESSAELPAPELPLQPLGYIEGRTLDETGGPLAGANLYSTHEVEPFKRYSLGMEEASVRGIPGRITYEVEGGGISDASGRFRLAVVPWESPYGIHAYVRGYVSLDVGPFLLPDSTVRPRVDITFVSGATLRGRVLENGMPWDDGSVAWRSGEHNGSAWIQNGWYEIPDVAVGEVHAFVRRRTSDKSAMAEVDLILSPGEVREHDFEWGVELASITGRVTAEDGTPCEGVFVGASAIEDRAARRDTDTTDSEGAFRLQVTPDRTYELRLWTWDMACRDRTVVPADTSGVELLCGRTASLRLTLVNGETGEPARLENARTVYIRWNGETEWRLNQGATVDVHGGFVLPLEAGNYDVRLDFSDKGYAPVELRAVAAEVVPGAPLWVELQPAQGGAAGH